MNRMEHVNALRANKEIHYNCCQSILIPFAGEMGITEEQAFALGAHFGSGMRHGSTCGALSGILMVLGALGYDEKQASAVIHSFRENHGDTACAALLKTSKERGESRKNHCDGLVCEMAQMMETLVSQR